MMHPNVILDVSMRQSRARIDYGVSGSSAHYEDAPMLKGLGRSHSGYGGSRSSLSTVLEAHGLHGSHQGNGFWGRPLSGCWMQQAM
ncbi:hypothetical protein J5N97_025192 [Dioscorea zingiberensis]|uniref:Uncharacterized protein n=1 Tax=Dioscorea zingiberensis TaxID=325984 RepID=A0A9D5C8Z2_9LILI|nr:hypothetical protein J5N97_025192 [Dioscorea zingiberensis]